MESFIFNDFKRRIIEGEVPLSDTWTLFPVNKSFTAEFDGKLEYIKSSSDLKLFYQANHKDEIYDFDNFKTNMFLENYIYQKLETTDLKSKPFFVTEENFEYFLTIFPGQEHLKELFFSANEDRTIFYNFTRPDHTVKEAVGDNIVDKVVFRGFYYVNTAEELKWCAEKVNGTIYDNKINIVLGDNIGVNKQDFTIDSIANTSIDNNSDFKIINFSIGSNPAQPFEGVFYGNGFKFVNIVLDCQEDVNGIFGYIGTEGIVSTVRIDGVNILRCKKAISLTHLTTDGSNIYAGILCGKNNGAIENVNLNGNVIFTKFVPEMYHSKMKTDNKDQAQSTTTFEYYPNYYCYDNPGNIIPYIGYFNEGVFATFSGYNAQGNIQFYWNTESPVIYEGITQDTNAIQSPLEWYYFDSRPNISDETHSYFYMYNTYVKNRLNVLWYDGTIIDKAAQMAGKKAGQICSNGLYLVEPSDLLGYDPNGTYLRNQYGLSPQIYNRLKYAQYFNKSIKLSQQNRVAYYVSPLIGNNNSIVNNVCVSCSAYTSGTFVGFMGGIAGMQNYGNLSNICSCISAYDVPETSTDLKQKTYYKRDWEYNTLNGVDYVFPKKSIKNIGGLFGACVVQGNYGAPGLTITNVVAHLNNKNNIIFRDSLDTPMYDDYYFDNRFGTFAAMMELNTSNIGDFWNYTHEINNPQNRCIKVTNGTFGYAEYFAAEDGVLKCSPYCIESEGVNNYQYWMYGVASPLFAELKPTYLATPSVISTLFENVGTPLENNNTYSHVGIFGVDQNFAAPFSNPNFWSINTELDLPGVGGCAIDDTVNHVTGNYNIFAAAGGIPNSIIDRLNTPYSENFSIDVGLMASKLVYWENCQINNNYQQAAQVFTTVKYPAAAQIQPAWCATAVNANMDAVGDIFQCNGAITQAATAVGYNSRNALDYAANKVLTTYPYFGSDLELVPNHDLTYLRDQLGHGFKKVAFTAQNPAFNQAQSDFYVYDGVTADHQLANNVKEVYMTIEEEAFQYMPFTDVPIPGGDRDAQVAKINQLYKVSALLSQENGCNSNRTGVKEGRLVQLSHKFGWRGHYNERLYVPQIKINYGFSIYSDYTSDDERYNTFVIPFDVFTEQDAAAVDTPRPWPPDSTFEGFYIISYVDNGRYGDLNNDRHDYQWREPGRGIGSIHNYLNITKSEVIPITEYFTGFADAERTVQNWTQIPPVPAISRKKVVAKYRWVAENNRFEFIAAADPTQTTTDFSLAATGYFAENINAIIDSSDTAETIAYKKAHFFMDTNRVVLADDGKKYQCYGPLEGEELTFYPAGSLTPLTLPANPDLVIIADNSKGMNETAINLSNVTIEELNWQTQFEKVAAQEPQFTVHYINEWPVSAPYAYNYISLNYALYTIKDNNPDNITYPDPWYKLGIRGKFYNNLAISTHVDNPGLVATGENYTGYDPDGFNMTYLYNRTDAIKNNVNEANKNVSTQDDQLLNYYKYTYEKSAPYLYTDCKNGIPLDVKFDYKNDKTGFWFRMPNTSGHIEYNDKIHYGSNVFNIGKTLSQDSLLNGCFVSAQKTRNEYKWITSGFSADDFEGIYIRDSKEKPVMYIDVGLGECTVGTSWTLSAYPSVNFETESKERYNTLINQTSGLLLEID